MAVTAGALHLAFLKPQLPQRAGSLIEWSALGVPLRLAAFFKLETIAVASGLPSR
ncbi:hypothetical protein [Glutamicibacter protophormiae]|uniref:Uncharacterized protein n=1 Tax=Glutamicibacter protophormiae TaxID=37930 RepID=A0ABS4XTX4_GLUPR|nr:hypothetical protein [Glutamicibacter protophormiae]MBP2399969.1 hypothetical protein [Glutamicibacter protophormiae]WPR63284.1 hypothetical protein SLW72_10280 [Glutamicibacter protophormiae]WPR66780.1 hypothetical protein SLW73_10275 [Glutamicibacter protophormiae]GGL76272.1 hypothetical protein GCM10010038_02920 [Glutamicibacter protophormiae]